MAGGTIRDHEGRVIGAWGNGNGGGSGGLSGGVSLNRGTFASPTDPIPARAYTVAEVDALRRACRDRLIWGSYSGPPNMPAGGGYSSQTYKADEVNRQAEEMVRTHMMAGHVYADLIK